MFFKRCCNQRTDDKQQLRQQLHNNLPLHVKLPVNALLGRARLEPRRSKFRKAGYRIKPHGNIKRAGAKEKTLSNDMSSATISSSSSSSVGEPPESISTGHQLQTKSNSNILNNKRPFCHGCEFPQRTCLCPALPATPLQSLLHNCRIVVIQHPHEARKKNRSLPLVELCLFGKKTTKTTAMKKDDAGINCSCSSSSSSNNSDIINESLTAIQTQHTADKTTDGTKGDNNSDKYNDERSAAVQTHNTNQQQSTDFVMKTIVARRLGIYCDNDVMNILHDPKEVVVLVFPHEKALDLEDGLRLAEERCRNISSNIKNDNDVAKTSNCRKKKMNLIFIDATWKYAKEMEKGTDNDNEWPKNLIRVQLTPSSSSSSSVAGSGNIDNVVDGSDDGWKTPSATATAATFIERRFHIRTPPSPNHLSTAESIAWIVSRVENNPVIYEGIMTALDYMVSVWKKSITNNDDTKRG